MIAKKSGTNTENHFWYKKYEKMDNFINPPSKKFDVHYIDSHQHGKLNHRQLRSKARRWKQNKTKKKQSENQKTNRINPHQTISSHIKP